MKVYFDTLFEHVHLKVGFKLFNLFDGQHYLFIFFQIQLKPVLYLIEALHLKLTIGVFSRLNAHVRLSFVHTTLPLSALLLHCRLSPILGVDVGQVGW